jgi:hypothetical protein
VGASARQQIAFATGTGIRQLDVTATVALGVIVACPSSDDCNVRYQLESYL